MTAKEKEKYQSIHMWLRYHFGKADKCENENCEFKKPKRFEYALKKGSEYEYKRENFMMFCASCHRKYDGSVGKKGMSHNGKLAHNIKPVVQKTLNGITINTFPSITIASRVTKTHITGISNVLSGLVKTANDYKWEYKIN